jgi:phage-related protein
MNLKRVVFEGDSRKVLTDFSHVVRQDFGRQIFRLQEGKDPDDWKPFKSVGPGCREIRVRDADGIFRVIYVLILAEVVHVLHCFQKKLRKTSLNDVNIAAKRFKALKVRIRHGENKEKI